jgi:NAD(P)-dependent dehydrogenase (short-subunit alcohol dehydrogenase family)
VTDVTDEAAVRKLFEAAVAKFGRLDIAMLNAGIAGRPGSIRDYPADLFDQVIAVNVRGVWLGLKYAMKAMEPTGGSIVITSSTAGIRATPNMSPYTASKHAAIGLMRAAALEGAQMQKTVRVNTVNPATIDTPMVRELVEIAKTHPGRSISGREVPMGREGTADEVAKMMLFLASDESSFCTGGVYMVDGGATAGRI